MVIIIDCFNHIAMRMVASIYAVFAAEFWKIFLQEFYLFKEVLTSQNILWLQCNLSNPAASHALK